MLWLNPRFLFCIFRFIAWVSFSFTLSLVAPTSFPLDAEPEIPAVFLIPVLGRTFYFRSIVPTVERAWILGGGLFLILQPAFFYPLLYLVGEGVK